MLRVFAARAEQRKSFAIIIIIIVIIIIIIIIICVLLLLLLLLLQLVRYRKQPLRHAGSSTRVHFFGILGEGAPVTCRRAGGGACESALVALRPVPKWQIITSKWLHKLHARMLAPYSHPL